MIVVTNVCPMNNPCNWCKESGTCGYGNKCSAGSNHIDLCDKSYDAIAYRDKQPKDGIAIEIDPTGEQPGPCSGSLPASHYAK